VADLVTHTFGIAAAADAYRLLESRPCLAIRLDYPQAPAPAQPVRLRAPAPGRAAPGIGLAGAGAFATGTLLPALRGAGFGRFVAVATASGISARRAAERHGFEKAVSGPGAVIDDPDVGVVVIATPHDLHEELTIRALAAGRHVWCEKPLALTGMGLAEIETRWRDSGCQLTVGFNRRWAPAVAAARHALADVRGPRLVMYRIAAGRVPGGHWAADRRQGGRLVGEVCHFVDTAQALTGSAIEEVTALPGDAPGAGGDCVVALRFADGSLAAVGYGSAGPLAGKEWIEITAGPHRVVIDDFRCVRADGRRLWQGRQDKGHRAHAVAFRQAVRGGQAMPTETLLASMRATLAAAQQAGSP
jgi:predicted dehydrogenase